MRTKLSLSLQSAIEAGLDFPTRRGKAHPCRVPGTQFEQMDDSDDPATEPMNLATEPMIVVPYDPDIIVKEEVKEMDPEPELASPDEFSQGSVRDSGRAGS